LSGAGMQRMGFSVKTEKEMLTDCHMYCPSGSPISKKKKIELSFITKVTLRPWSTQVKIKPERE